ncbi:MAG: MobA/MobL family protein [Paracoccaceae bacterium]
MRVFFVTLRAPDPTAHQKAGADRGREIWEQICNEALRDLKHPARIDRRSLVDQGITDRKAPGHQGPQARQIEAKGKPAEKLRRIREAWNTSGKPEQRNSSTGREREAAWQRRTPQDLDDTARRSERVLEGLRRMAEGIWQGQRDRDAARKALRAQVNGVIGSRIFPEAVTRHFEDITAIVFRRKRKQPMPLRETSFFAGSTALTQPQPPRQTPKPNGRIKLRF